MIIQVLNMIELVGKELNKMMRLNRVKRKIKKEKIERRKRKMIKNLDAKRSIKMKWIN